jgi:integrase
MSRHYPHSRLSAEADQPFLASLIPGRSVRLFSRHTLRKRIRTACKALGAARLEMLTIHHGRHTFISHALAGVRTLAEVRDSAGHCNVSITSSYLHVAVDDEAAVGNLFRLVGLLVRESERRHYRAGK